MKSITVLISAVGISIMHMACESFLAIDLSPQLIESKHVFADEQAALSAVNGVYIQMRSTSLGIGNGGLTVYSGLAVDELRPVNQHDTYSPFYLNTLSPDNSAISSQLWAAAYRTIYHCNSIIEQLGNPSLTAIQSIVLGEMKFVRAFHYYYMVHLFGDVPLILTTDYKQNMLMGRTDKSLVVDQVLADLLDAEMRLPESYATSGKIRPNKWAATTLLARLQLLLGNYENALLGANEVIQSGSYTLENDLSKTFRINSAETI
ncbi:RagB/SusD family nutrient uptake outer membrane protein [Parapedobacter deserti]|uniref:RagB/SusD family nutrient uptake outer membrane protein n=1 Tax=Parapedobacter deserti TaxID=1912957 RepID=A0ABV7JJV2_9SPHI